MKTMVCLKYFVIDCWLAPMANSALAITKFLFFKKLALTLEALVSPRMLFLLLLDLLQVILQPRDSFI